jgi:hypothetical protein
MPEQKTDFSEILVVPLTQMIQNIAKSVSEAQRALDITAMEMQNTLQNNYPDLARIGYQVSWYQIPEINVELKIAVHYERTGEENNRKVGLFLSPYNAKYKNAFTYNAEGSSTLKLRIVPVPPMISANNQ